MYGFSHRPVSISGILLWALLLGASLPLTGQIPINRYDYLNKRGRKESNTSETFNIYLNITDLNGDKAQAFQQSKGNTFDFGGAEKGLINITIDFPPHDDLQLILRKDCISASSNLTLSGPYTLKGRDQDFSTEQKVHYQVTENGPFEIKINYNVLHKTLNPLEFDCEDGKNYLTLTGEIKGIVKEQIKQAPPRDTFNCERVIAENRTNCTLLLEMIRTNSSCIFEARDALFTYKEDLYKKCMDDNSLDDCYSFRDCDARDPRIGKVKQKIKELEGLAGDGKKTEDAKRWEEIEKSTDYKLFLEFYQKYSKGKYNARAFEALQKYYPWTFSLVEKQGNRKVFQIDSIKFVKGLRWKDVSPSEGLVINAANLPVDGKVEVSSSDLGNYLVYFQDAYGRLDSISFSTQLKGTLKPGKDKYMVYFEGGTPPYKVELVDMGQNKTVKSFPVVKNDSFAISLADVEALNLPHLKVWIQDASNIRVSAEGDILLEEPLDLQRIAAFAIVVLLSLFVIYLLVSFFRRRNRRKVQFQEA